MNKTYSTKAIVLNRKDFGEADRLFALYTEDYGKIEAIATSARKAASKMAKFLEPMMEIDLLLARGRSYDRIAEVSLIDNFTELKSESHQWALGCYCLEVVDKITKVEVPQKDIFDLIRNILNLLKKGNNHLIQFYIWQLLGKLGYKPELEKCARCGLEFNSNDYLYFSHRKGSIICQQCSAEKKEYIKISSIALEILKKGLREDLVNLQDLDIEHKESGSINQVISSLLNFHLDYGLNSVRFFVIIKA